MGSEWTYLLTTRKVAGDDSAFSFVRLQYGSNPTDTVTGVVIYPDDFSFADAGVGAMSFGAYAVVAIDMDAWEALEDAGCVFLPKNRGMDSDGNLPRIEEALIGYYSFYWSSTAANQQRAASFQTDNTIYFRTGSNGNTRWFAVGVRLVQDY